METTTNQSQQPQSPSFDQLEKERLEVLAKLNEIQKTQQSNEESKAQTNELDSLREENKKLTQLVEQYKTDVLNASKFAQQVMLEYGANGHKVEQQNEQQVQPNSLKDAENALNEYIKSKLQEEN